MFSQKLEYKCENFTHSYRYNYNGIQGFFLQIIIPLQLIKWRKNRDS